MKKRILSIAMALTLCVSAVCSMSVVTANASSVTVPSNGASSSIMRRTVGLTELASYKVDKMFQPGERVNVSIRNPALFGVGFLHHSADDETDEFTCDACFVEVNAPYHSEYMDTASKSEYKDYLRKYHALAIPMSSPEDIHPSVDVTVPSDGTLWFDFQAYTKGNGSIIVSSYKSNRVCEINVTSKDAPTSIKINSAGYASGYVDVDKQLPRFILGAGESCAFNASINKGSYVTPDNVMWSTTGKNLNLSKTCGYQTVVKAGAGGSHGTLWVMTHSENRVSDEVFIEVKNAPKSVKLSNTNLTLGKGETITISETTDIGSYANPVNLKWSSSNANVATVTKGSGNKATITAKGVGTATITIKTYNGKTATCKVTVKNAPSSVKLSTTNLTLNKGESYTISEITNSGSYANASNLKWGSTNLKVATVTKGSGNKATIKAVNKGTAYIKITTYNGKAAICKVTVR